MGVGEIGMAQILLTRRGSLAACVKVESDADIRERHLKHIAEITKHLANTPIESEDLKYQQEEWIKFRMARPFPEPYRVWAKRERAEVT